jgi:signal transduction histidine kinase
MVRVTEVALSEAALPRVFQLTTAPLVDKEGTFTHVVQVGQDVTQQKRIQAGMVRAEKLAAVGELAGKIAHEVNNPIAIISAKARLLLADGDEPLPAKAVDELTKITNLADRVARIAQGLLSYCRPAAGPAAPLDLRIPIRRALAIVETPAAGAGVRIEEHLTDPVPEACANGGEMEQVFLNLFLNSLDAMPRGGVLSVSARAERGDAGCSIRILVEDTGCGVPEEIMDHVFEPFVTTKGDSRGTGLGLSICLGLVRSAGGEIELESEPGRGTRVRLRFPVHTR